VRFIDLFAGLGGFHQALTSLGHECVFASDIDEQLANLYYKNFGIKPHGDIRETYKLVPKCSSSDNLRPIRHFENGGSGSSGVRV
jgi:site-specific DNA-cytosine methylase